MTQRPILRIYRPVDDDGNYMTYKGMFDGYTSLQWQNCYNSSGAFEIHTPYRPELAELFDVFDFVRISRPIKEPFGIVVYTEVSTDENGFTQMMVRGYTLSYLLTFRFLMPAESLVGKQIYKFSYANANAPYIMELMLAKCAAGIATSSDKSRMFFGKQIKTIYGTTKEYPREDCTKDCTMTVYDGIRDIAEENNIGFCVDIDMDNIQLTATLYDYTQTDVRFDLQRGGISSIREVKSIDNYVTDVSINSARGLVEATMHKNDILRIDRYIMPEGTNPSGNPATTGQQTGQAYKKTALNKEVYSVSVDVTDMQYKYLEDYNLGDVVTVVGIARKNPVMLPITGVTEIWEDFYRIQVDFGQQMQTVYEKMQNNMIRRQKP